MPIPRRLTISLATLATLALFALPGCGVLGGLTPLKTQLTVEGPAESLRYLMTGDGAPSPGAPIAVHYETSADKAVGLQVDNTYSENGTPASLFLDFTSASDSEFAEHARTRDNDRLASQTDSLLNFAGQLVALGAMTSGIPAGGAAPSGGSDIAQLVALLQATQGQPSAGTSGLDAAQLLALLQVLQPAPAPTETPKPTPSPPVPPPEPAPTADTPTPRADEATAEVDNQT